MNYEDNPKSIKFYIKRFIVSNKDRFKDKKVVDFPSGNGITSRIVQENGGIPYPFDLFPEYFKIDGLKCEQANINERIPTENDFADFVICQEGIEHFSDQLKAFKEFSRILKKGGTLIMTTPNYSNIRAKLSYLLGETERFNSMMAPNELDSIWMSKQELNSEIYYGHIFLTGIQKLRVLGQISGFKIKEVHFTRSKPTSTLLLPFFYPAIWISNKLAYRKSMRKNDNYDVATKKKVYGEIFKLSTNWKILTDNSLMVEFEKIMDHEEVGKNLKSIHKEFGRT